MINSDWCRSSTLAVWLVGISLASGAPAQTADVSQPTAGPITVADQTSTQSGDQPNGQAPSNPAPQSTQDATPPAATPPATPPAPTSPAPQTPNPPAATTQDATPSAPTPQATQAPEATETNQQKAQQQLKQEEKQRVLGVVPNFNTSYISDAVPLSPRQKLDLAFRSAVDPFVFFAAGVDAAVGQAQNSFAQYGQGWGAYGKYFGASYADDFDGTMIGNAFLPILLKQDPRYFRMGTGTFKRRLVYSLVTTVWCKNDNGKWGPNYSNVVGNLAAGGISNLYYPSEDRGAALTIERGFTVTAEGTIGALFDEFWPDIARKVFKGRYAKLQGNIPGATGTPTTTPAPPPK